MGFFGFSRILHFTFSPACKEQAHLEHDIPCGVAFGGSNQWDWIFLEDIFLEDVTAAACHLVPKSQEGLISIYPARQSFLIRWKA